MTKKGKQSQCTRSPRMGHRFVAPFWLFACATLLGCPSWTIKEPKENQSYDGATVGATTVAVNVLIEFGFDVRNFKAMLDNADVSSSFNVNNTNHTAAAAFGSVPLGAHTLTAEADQNCWYCSGRTTHSTGSVPFYGIPLVQ